MKKLSEQKGFTVAELLIVVAIVAVLVAIALPTFTAQLASAKEAVDTANCRSAQAAATTVCLTDCHGDFSKKTIEEWIQIALADGIPKNGQADPTSTLNCQIESNNHLIKFFYGEGTGTTPSPNPDTPGTDPSNPDVPSVPDVPDPDTPDTPDTPANTFPNTDIPVSSSDGIWPPQSEWDDNPNKNVIIEPSGIFLYEGEYYVVNTRTEVTQGQAAGGPGGVVLNWYHTQKLTGRVITDWTTNEQRDDLTRGDIVQTGGNSYVFIDGGHYGYNPGFGASGWYKLP